ncbi:hypothetical protein AB6735_18705 [Mucilaginibacter sp. RCC_168]|uniref:hypothetical protein n=1 Tax=Mucilaginibacter sp. RCC_168 TaxID=3239221 RepID=UPI0035251202
MPKPTFILNDENVINSYGFRVRNAGLIFDRFDDNPVMLDSHYNETEYVAGRWDNRRIDGTLLKMDADFDTELDCGKRLAGQVDRKFVKGASLGLSISFDEWEDSFQRQPDGNWDLIKAEVMEGSVCGVPSNAGSLCLYDKATGKKITEAEIKLSLQKLSATTVQELTPNTNEMKEFKLSAPAMAVLVNFGLANQESENEINEAIIKLNAELKTQKDTNATLKTEVEKQLKLQAEKMVDAAILDERIVADDRETYVQLAVTNFDLASKLLAAKPVKKSLSNTVVTPENPDGAKLPKTIDEFEKLSADEKASFKLNHGDAFKLLFAPKR